MRVVLALLVMLCSARAAEAPLSIADAELMAWQGRFVTLAPACGQRPQQWGWRLERGLLDTTGDPAYPAAPREAMAWREGALAAAEQAGEYLFIRWTPNGCALFSSAGFLASADVVASQIPAATLMEHDPTTYLDGGPPFQWFDGLQNLEVAAVLVDCHKRPASYLNLERAALREGYQALEVQTPADIAHFGDVYTQAFIKGAFDETVAIAGYETTSGGSTVCTIIERNPVVGALDTAFAKKTR